MVAYRDILLLASLLVSATAAPGSVERARIVRDEVVKRTWETKHHHTMPSSTMSSSSSSSAMALSDTSTSTTSTMSASVSAATPLSDTSLSTTSCSTDGSLVCSSDGMQFGICNFGNVTFQAVAAGTMCKNGAIVHAGGTTSAPMSGSANSKSTIARNPKWANSTRTATATAVSPTFPALPPRPKGADHTTPSASLGNGSKKSEGLDYHVYLGNGSPSQGWPTMDQWAEFDDMWTKSLHSVMGQSCSSWGQPENSDEENRSLKNAILKVSKSSRVDPRFVLAVVLQESVGCVRVATTNGGVKNPGLMQSHAGTHSCYKKHKCPDSEIVGMIRDGVDGTSAGPGLKQLISHTNTTSVAKYYRAARMYNSGSIASNGKLQCGIATNSYCSDIANRLTMQWYRGFTTFPTDACRST